MFGSHAFNATIKDHKLTLIVRFHALNRIDWWRGWSPLGPCWRAGRFRRIPWRRTVRTYLAAAPRESCRCWGDYGPRQGTSTYQATFVTKNKNLRTILCSDLRWTSRMKKKRSWLYWIYLLLLYYILSQDHVPWHTRVVLCLRCPFVPLTNSPPFDSHSLLFRSLFRLSSPSTRSAQRWTSLN